MDNNLELLKLIPTLSSTALVLFLWFTVNKDKGADLKFARDEREARDKLFLDQLTRIENNHREEERADRDQNKALFDRVIAICGELSKAVSMLDSGVRGLSTATQANERAIVELREEMTKLRQMGDRHNAEEAAREHDQPRRRSQQDRPPKSPGSQP